jgi:hypothetical protein
MKNDRRRKVFRGGIAIGHYNATWPFAKLKMGPNEIQISYWYLVERRQLLLSKSSVIAIRKVRVMLFSQGVEFEYKKKDQRVAMLTFWTFHPEEILSLLQKHGYPLE